MSDGSRSYPTLRKRFTETLKKCLRKLYMYTAMKVISYTVLFVIFYLVYKYWNIKFNLALA